jgi:hypothetical protein
MKYLKASLLTALTLGALFFRCIICTTEVLCERQFFS